MFLSTYLSQLSFYSHSISFPWENSIPVYLVLVHISVTAQLTFTFSGTTKHMAQAKPIITPHPPGQFFTGLCISDQTRPIRILPQNFTDGVGEEMLASTKSTIGIWI